MSKPTCCRCGATRVCRTSKDGISKPEDTKGTAGRVLLAPEVNSSVSTEKYAFTKTSVRRNIYRVWVE